MSYRRKNSEPQPQQNPHSATDPDIAFLGWAALGSLGLAFFHDAYLGARDWDVLALPVLFYTLLGYTALSALPTTQSTQRLLRWSVLPIALLHTAL